MDNPDDEPVDVWIRNLPVGMCDAKKQLAKVQFDLNLYIAEL